MKLIINFGKNDLSFEGDEEWCKEAFQKVTDSMRKPKNDIFTFSKDGTNITSTIRLSKVRFLRLDAEAHLNEPEGDKDGN